MQAFDGAPFTAAMLHARLVTMRWRLAFTPIYALLSERGGSSVTICPFSDGKASVRAKPDFSAELEATEHPQDEQASITMDDSPSAPTPLEQMLDTRVLLSVSVVQEAIHDVSHWVSWLTTAAPWDVTKVDVQVHSIFKSHSTLVVISVPTSAWNRLPERPAYRFIGFIKSGDIYQAAGSSMKSMTEPISSRKNLPLDKQKDTLLPPYQHKKLLSEFRPYPAFWPQTMSLEATSRGADEMKTSRKNPTQHFPSVREAEAEFYPTNLESEFQSNPQAQSINQRHERQRIYSLTQPIEKVQVPHHARFPASEVTTSRSSAATWNSQSHVHSYQHLSMWPPENDELLMRARSQGLDWHVIAGQHFPDKTANACRKRHERLMEKRNSAGNWDGVKIETLAKAYVDVREQMWEILADRVGEPWQNVEAKVCHPTCDLIKFMVAHSCSSA